MEQNLDGMYQQAMQALKAGHAAGAVELLEAAAEEGHAEAAYELGVCFRDGIGTQTDLRTAYELFLRAGIQGCGKGYLQVGRLFAQGLGGEKRKQDAVRWYYDAACSTDPETAAEAEYWIGQCFAEGCGVAQSREMAIEWYHRAMGHGEERAKQALETMGESTAFLIRECRMEDAAALQKLSAEALGYDDPLPAVEERLRRLLERDSNRIFVAAADGRVVGYVHACDYEVLYAPSMKNILGLAVEETARKQGIGRALLRKVEDWAKETGAAGVRLMSGEERTGAHAFYQQCGYEQQKKQCNFKKSVEK